ncbi:MAG: hypothetical protein H6581_29960 [Bacteroidia bacterium]|nr:hypothetical protein [Bacteroidia bacterium]
MTIIFCLGACLYFLSGCGKSPSQRVERNNFSFVCPNGWSITEDMALEDHAGYSVTIEKEGWGEDGIITINSFNDTLDIIRTLEAYRESMTSGMALEASEIHFTQIDARTFGELPGLGLTMTFAILGQPVSMEFFGVYCGGKTLIISLERSGSESPYLYAEFQEVVEGFSCY